MSWTFHIEPEEKTYEIFVQNGEEKIRIGTISCSKGGFATLDFEKVRLNVDALEALCYGLSAIHATLSADFGPEAR